MNLQAPSQFFLLSFTLLLCIHDKVSLIQDWMLDWAEMKSVGGALSEISMSSAYLWWSQLWHTMTSDRGCEYRVNSTVRGPIPEEHQRQGVLVWPWTSNRQPQQTASLRYDSNQDSANPEIPKVLSSRLNRIAWSRVSKAALRSNSASTDTSFWSDFVRRPSSTLKTAVSVL